jgi:hypothetical protein
MLSDAYNAGVAEALESVGLEKDAASMKGFGKALLGSALALGGGAKAARHGAEYGGRALAQRTADAMYGVLDARAEAGQRVDTKKFLHKYMPDLTFIPAKNFLDGNELQEAMQGDYAKYLHGDRALIAGPKVDPAVLAHELGHALQEESGVLEDTNGLLSKFLGKKVKQESDAWRRATDMGYPTSKDVEKATIGAYEAERDGTRAGGVLGGLLGSLPGLGLLSSSLKRRR